METVFFILKIEAIVLFTCFASMIIVRLFRNWQQWKSTRNRKKMEDIITESIMKNTPLHIDQIASADLNYKDLLVTVETFDRFFLDPIWQEIRQNLIDEYLGKKGKMLIQSSNWRDRVYGLRCIRLDPKSLLDKKIVTPLLKDSKFIVRVLAASSMIHAEEKDQLLEVLKQMSNESSMARYPYRDFLINSREITFKWIEEIANDEKNPALIAICLEILSSKITHNLLPLAIKHINSPDSTCRLAAIKIISSIPGNESEKHLIMSLADINWEIRAEAASGLGRILAIPSIPELSLTLQDPEWFVRLNAAQALKMMGSEGRAALYNQNLKLNPQAYEVATYILGIP